MYLEGIIFASGEDAQPQPGSACAPFSDCNAELKVSESTEQAMQANDFNQFCQIVDSFSHCLDEKHAATQCKDDPAFISFDAMLLLCQPPQRRGISIIS